MAARSCTPLVRGSSIGRRVRALIFATGATLGTTSCTSKTNATQGPTGPVQSFPVQQAPPVGPSVQLQLTVSPTQVAQGQTANFSVTWATPLTDDTLLLVLTGADTGQAFTVIPSNTFGVQGTVSIPAATPDGTVYLHAYVHAVHDSATDSLVVLDNQPPAVAPGAPGGWILSALPLPPTRMPPNGVTFVAGTTDSAQFNITDNHALAWAGWALGPPANLRDSIPVSGTDTAASVPIALPTALAGTSATIEFFARDADGNLGEFSFGNAAIAQYADHPVATLAHTTPVPDLAVDMKHNVLLVADPANRQVDVLSLPGLTPQATVSLAHAPVGIDVTPGGDSAFVLLDSTKTFAIINLASGNSVTTGSLPLIPYPSSTDSVSIGWRVRIAANDHAIIITRSLDTTAMAVVEINLATGAQSVALPVTARGSNVQPVLRSPDGTLILMPAFPYPNTNQATMYTSASATYAETTVPYNTGPYPPLYSSVSNSPYDYLGIQYLIDASSVVFGYIGMNGLWGGVISPNAADAYVPASSCLVTTGPCMDSAAAILHYRVPTDQAANPVPLAQALDVADAPETPLVLAISPDGKTLIGVGATMLMAFDLTHSSPPPSSRRVRPPTVVALNRLVHSPRTLAGVQTKSSGRAPAQTAIRITGFHHASRR